MNHRRRRMMLAAAIVMLAGCEQTATNDPSMPGRKIVNQAGSVWTEIPDSGRFTVTIHKRFNTGYGNNPRDILVIHDTQSGTDYLAVTGCGTTEIHDETRRVGKVHHVEHVEE